MKIKDTIEKIDDAFFKFAPNFIYRWWHSIFDFTGHVFKLKRFGQRIFRGWDDSETWSLDSSFLRWLEPRLKRFQELNICYPGDKRYPTFESWNNELQYRCWQLSKLIEYEWNEWEFPYQEYLVSEKTKDNQKENICYNNSRAYYRCKQDFMIWYSDVINHLWW